MTETPTFPRPLSHQSWEWERQAPGGIVAGVDGSRESITAFNTAAAIARTWSSALHVVTVLHRFPSYHINPGTDKGKDIDRLRMDLKDSELREVLKASQPEESWTHEVVMGRTAEVLTSVAEHRGADLIVVGRTRHGPLDRVFGGETTLQVMRTSAVSVLAVAAELDHPRTIVVATDFFPASVQAAKVALRLLGKAGTLYIAYVGPPLDLLPNGFTLPGETRFPGDVVVCFRRLIDGLGGHSGVLVEPITLTGKPVSAILEFAERVGADVIAAGSHSHSRMERVLLGSVSTGLVRNAHCAVLVAPACD